MLGCDSSHTETYAGLMNVKESPFYGKARVEWLWGIDVKQAREKAAKLNISMVCENIGDAIVNADLVMVLGRYGDDHFLPAKLAVEAGKTVYVDKPFTNNFAEALALATLAKENKVRLMSFSAYRFSKEFEETCAFFNSLKNPIGAVFSCPADCKDIADDRVKDIHWYGVHVTDLLTSLITVGVKSVKVTKSEQSLWVNVVFKNGWCATLCFPYHADDFIHWTVMGREQSMHKSIDISGDYYQRSLDFVLRNTDRNNKFEFSISHTCESIAILDAIVASQKENKEIILETYEI